MFFTILSILLFLFLVVLVLLPSIIVSFISSVLSLFGIRKKETQHQRRDNSRYGGSGTESATAQKTKHYEQRKKVFEKDEGEYVDFEEIK